MRMLILVELYFFGLALNNFSGAIAGRVPMVKPAAVALSCIDLHRAMFGEPANGSATKGQADRRKKEKKTNGIG